MPHRVSTATQEVQKEGAHPVMLFALSPLAPTLALLSRKIYPHISPILFTVSWHKVQFILRRMQWEKEETER